MNNDEAKYAIGDEVKIWTVSGRPIGRVTSIKAEPNLPSKYSISYEYQDGRKFIEYFTEDALSLHEKASISFNRCDCGLKFAPSGGKHKEYCRLKGSFEKGKVS